VYGWAKYSAMMGLIARLAYGEVAEQPEAVKDAQRYVKPKMWDFLVTGIMVSLIIFGAIIPFSIVFGILGAVMGAVFGSEAGAIIGVLLGIAALLIFIFGFIWLISRLFLVELPLAIEENTTATSTISRSWSLTKGSVGRIQLIVFIAFLISLPIILVTNIVSFIFQGIVAVGLENVPGLASVGFILSLVIAIASGSFMIPFWQSIKSVIYHDLRVRREGIGLDLNK
ncbi:MAG: DUF975 domain-containing protein, partial [Cyanobacteria bacterium J06638_38]